MKVVRILPLIAVVSALAFLSGCNDDIEPTQSRAKKQNFQPGLGRYNIASTGGHAIGLTGRSGGDGGDVSLSVTGGQLKPDDGRAFTTPASNVLTNALIDDGVVTYAEFQSIPGYAIAAGVGTLTLAGQGFHLPNGVTLDLSGAPYTGVAPATDILSIVVTTDEAIRIDGTIVTTRVGNDAVNIALDSSHSDGVTLRGNINSTGADTFDGGNVGASATAGPVLALGLVNASGGRATATVDGGDGGDIALTAANGDLLLRGGTFTLYGGEAQQDGGDGGSINVSITGAGTSSFDWSSDQRGGEGVEGNGGNGGDFDMNAVGLVLWYSAIFTGGGHGETDIGSDGGDITLDADEHGGELSLNTSGGDVMTGTGGLGGFVRVLGSATVLVANANTSGGRGDTGGNGGDFIVDTDGTVYGCTFGVNSQGGHGGTDGGDGGDAGIIGSAGNILVQLTTLTATASGGNALTGTGGNGGQVGINNALANSATILDCILDVVSYGGNGDTGATGGVVAVQTGPGGDISVDVYADLSGGASDTGSGGTGGVIDLNSAGSLTAYLSAVAYGGWGSTGGDGGVLVTSSESSTWIGGTFSARGGASDSDGGIGGSISLSTGTLAGGISLDGASLAANGGNGVSTGGDGGSVSVDSSGAVLQTAGSLAANGGNADTGTGGLGGSISVRTDDDDILLTGQLRAVGGSGPSAGDTGGDITIDSDDDGAGDAGDITLLGVVTVEGGDAPGSSGGNGGTVSVDATAAVGTSGSISVENDIRANTGAGNTVGPIAGTVTLDTDGTQISVTGRLFASAEGAGNGGNIALQNAAWVVLGVSSVLRANGAGTGTAGFITLDPAGVAPNPNLVELPGSIVETLDGNGTDQSGTNVTRD